MSYTLYPQVTLYHWDLPQSIQNDGGWLDSNIQEKFVDYASYCFEQFGDRVRKTLTLDSLDPIQCILCQLLLYSEAWNAGKLLAQTIRIAVILLFYSNWLSYSCRLQVKHWILVNEPMSHCVSGYEYGIMAPGVAMYGVGAYQCSHNMVLAHAKTYRAYQASFAYQGGTH